MNNDNSNELSNPRLDYIVNTLIKRRKLWLLPGLAALMASWVYVYFVRAETYTARQSLIVRDDLLGQSLKPGQFDSLDLMKSAQETILEIARKPQVIRNALKQVGPSNRGWFGVSSDWPSDKVIEEVQGSIGFSAPNGAEFGHTEVIVLSAKGSNRERARKFILALLNEIDTKIRAVRNVQLSSMKDELRIIRDSTQASLAESSERLRKMEEQAGANLPTLRALSDPQSGEGAMAQTLLQIRSEKRQADNELASALSQRSTLDAATDNPDAILATSDELFKFQPALNRLKQELIEAQSALAESVGRYERAHPTVQKHEEQVRTMHRQIHAELDSAQRGLTARINLLESKVAKLDGMEAEIQDTFNSLSSLRVDYRRLDEEVNKKTEVFNEAQSNLASIQQVDLSEGGVTLLTRVDPPQVSTRADGLGKTTTILGGGLAGFLAGLGLVLLLAPNPGDVTPQLKARSRPPQPTTPTASPVVAPSAITTTAGPTVETHPVASKPEAAIAGLSPTAKAASAKPAETKPPIVKPTPDPVVSGTVAATNAPTESPNTSPAASEQTPVTKAPVPTPAPTPEPVKPRIDRTKLIEAEIDAAVARGFALPISSNDTPADASQASTAPATAQTALGSTESIGEDPETPQRTNPFNKNRGTGDSSGVPTAASILAALDGVEPIAKPAAPTPAATPQPPTAGPVPTLEPIAENRSAQISGGDALLGNSEVAELDRNVSPAAGQPETSSTTAGSTAPNPITVQRRPIEIIKQVASETPSETEAPETSGATAEETTAELARQALVDAKINAALEGTLPPVAPAPTEEDKAEQGRLPASTIAIPDQIRKLSDSISSLAKPISRVNENPKS